MTFDSRQLSGSYHSSSSPSAFILVIVIAIIIVVIIITIHHHFSCVLSSHLLPPAFFQATLSSRVFICFYPCASAVSFFEAKLVLQSLRSVLRTSLQTLQHSVVQCSWNLAWATVLGHVA